MFHTIVFCLFLWSSFFFFDTKILETEKKNIIILRNHHATLYDIDI